ncbi:MAG: ABC transporter ATP-binding protein [Dehalococcoidia bacterium]|nr:ABC transporter ATP-binding protein [Dehalococcoidia bacterium]
MDTVLQVKDLTKLYRRRRAEPVVAVDRVSFSVSKNEVVGLLGPNGAGKTTTIKCIAGLIKPTSGEIWLDGIDAIRRPGKAMERVAALLEGNRNIYWRLTPRENLEFFAGIQGHPVGRVRGYIDELIELFDLKDKERTSARMLSRGMQQKLALACALVRQTEVLLLDEPTLGLDVETSYELRHILKQMGARGERTILLSSHDMHVVQDICERVVIINNGRVVVDDRVRSLMKLFRASAYRFELEGQLAEELALTLRGRFPLLALSATDHRTYIDADLKDGNELYEVLDILKGGNTQIKSIGHKEPNLEEIFLTIVKGQLK